MTLRNFPLITDPAARRAYMEDRIRQRMQQARVSVRGAGAADDAAELYLYDVIGAWGVTASDFQAALNSSSGDVRVRISSPGGDVSHGLAIYNSIKRARDAGQKITTHVDAEASSMASYIMLAGERVFMSENATVMIHEPWTIAYGDEKAMLAAARSLAVARDSSLVPGYAAKTGKSVADIRVLLAAETWLDADASLADGFIDEIEYTVAPSASRFPNTPRPVPSQPAATASLRVMRQEPPRPGAAAASKFKPEGN